MLFPSLVIYTCLVLPGISKYYFKLFLQPKEFSLASPSVALNNYSLSEISIISAPLLPWQATIMLPSGVISTPLKFSEDLSSEQNFQVYNNLGFSKSFIS